MKKLGKVLVLCVVMLLLCSCGKVSMVKHQGVWLLEDSAYYVVDQNQVARIKKDAISQLYTDTMTQTFTEKGREAFWNLAVKDIPLNGQLEQVADTAEIQELEMEEGTLTAKKKTLTFQKDGNPCNMEKISDEPTLSEDLLQKLFDDCKQNVVVQMKQVLPTVQEYGDFIKQSNEKIAKWKTVKREDNAYMVSTNGKAKSHKGALLITDTAVTYSKGTEKGIANLLVEYSGTQLTVTHKLFGSLEGVVAFAAPILDALPYNMSTEQLLAIYRQQRVQEDEKFLFRYEEGGVEYSITRSVTGRKTELKINVPAEMKLPVAPLERTEVPYTVGFHTEAFAGLSNKKAYNISYKFDGYPVSEDFLFDEDGKFYLLCYVEYGFEYVIDRYWGEYEVNGDEITIWFEKYVTPGMSLGGSTYELKFRYDPQKKTLTQLSDRGFAYTHKPGKTYKLSTSKLSAKDVKS